MPTDRSDRPISDHPTVVQGTTRSGSRDAPLPPRAAVPAVVDERYELKETLGEGGTGRVYAAVDKKLGREVALKVAISADPASRESFVREARVTASLEHPNVPPVHDLVTTGDAPFLTMRRLRGQSLGDRIREATAAKRTEVMPVADLIVMLLKLCDALSYAHARGIIHKDIKPDNVMIGEFGEVMLVDWGSASESRDLLMPAEHVAGTPGYMAPEQARGLPTASSDVYALGVLLFQLLLLRRPLVDPDRDRFWRRKFEGALDMPTDEELTRVPRALVGIALKAMSARQEDRYQTVSAFARALLDYQSGANAWSAPLVVETFADADVFSRWTADKPSEWRAEGGLLHADGPGAGLLVYRRRLTAGIAIEFEGMILPDGRPGDMSIVWTDDDIVAGDRARWPAVASTVSLKVGAADNVMAGVFRDIWQCVSGRHFRLERGRWYRIRGEIETQALRLFVDGELIAESEQLFPFTSGYLALYTYYPGKVIRNLRIYERGASEHVGPLAVGDAFFELGQFQEAARRYQGVEAVLRGSSLAEEARFKRGLSMFSAGSHAAADELWRSLHSPLLRARADLQRTEIAFANDDHERVVSELRAVMQKEPALRALAIQRWGDFVARLRQRSEIGLAPYVRLHDELFPDDPTTEFPTATALLSLCRFEEVIERYKDKPYLAFDAYIALGRANEAVSLTEPGTYAHRAALVYAGRHREAADGTWERAAAEIWANRPKEGLAMHRSDFTHLANGLYEPVLSSSDRKERATALRGLGRLDEAVALGDIRAMVEADAGESILSEARWYSGRAYAFSYLATRAYLSGDRGGFGSFHEQERSIPASGQWEGYWIHHFVLLPFMDELLGDAGALERSLRDALSRPRELYHQMLHFAAHYILGEMGDDEFLAQPRTWCVRGRLFVCRAIRAEWTGDAEKARADYRAFSALPRIERSFDAVIGDPIVERWARARSGP